mgnify:CR=1 FL=1
MGKKDESLLFEGRLVDGWAYLVGLKDGQVARVNDSSSPENLWERIKTARKDKTDVVFSGARTEPNGKLDGFGSFFAEDITSLRNFGPSAMGVGPLETRLAAFEDSLRNVDARFDDLEDEVFGEDEGEAEGPALADAPVTPEAQSALVAASDEGDGGEEEDAEDEGTDSTIPG